MPIYEYKCDNGHVFDVIQKISDEPLDSCQECGAPARRVLHPVAVHFKGSGFYNTDYGRKKGGGNGGGQSDESGKGSDSSGSSKSGGSQKSGGSEKSGSSEATAKAGTSAAD